MNMIHRYAQCITLRRVAGKIENDFDFTGPIAYDKYRVYIMDSDDQTFAILHDSRGVGTEDLELDVNRFDVWNNQMEDKITSHGGIILEDRSLVIHRRYTPSIYIIYKSEFDFALRDWWYPTFLIAKEWLLQRHYNITKRTLIRRMEVLRVLVKSTIDRRPTSPHEILTRQFGSRISQHPNVDRITREMDLILASLVETGNVEVLYEAGEVRYQARGFALDTLDYFDRDNNRHIGNVVITILGSLISAGWIFDKIGL